MAINGVVMTDYYQGSVMYVINQAVRTGVMELRIRRYPDAGEHHLIYPFLMSFSITPAAVSKLGHFHSSHSAVSFGRCTKSYWSLLPGVCVREVKDLPQGNGKKICCGLPNCREGQSVLLLGPRTC